MSHQLINLNDDLRRLRDEGYNIYIDSAYLVLRDVPYVNEARQVLYDGVLACPLNLNDEVVNKPDNHQMRFAGQCPCTGDGRRLEALSLVVEELRISEKLTTNFHFSSKPKRGHYIDYYEKASTYAGILGGHAAVLDPLATPKTRRVIEPEDEDSPFNYLDTASARAEINMVTKKLAVERLAIVGLGGTGSYVLDLLAKTPAREIHLFDGDKFSSHNAFRAPGAAAKEDLQKQQLKVDYLKEIYSKIHRGIVIHPEDVDEKNVDQLRGMSCVFLCLDASPSKKVIVEKLEEYGIPFIDTGMGLYIKNETIGGNLRVTASDKDNRATARARMSFPKSNAPDDYDKNIQIADLNALNAILAVIRWKKMQGFYFDFKRERFTSYTVGTNVLVSEDIHEQG